MSGKTTPITKEITLDQISHSCVACGEVLAVVPLNLDEANAFVERWHRHHGPVPGGKFAIGAAMNGIIVGVAICGRPVARMSDNGWTLEVNRTCTDGTKNVNSFLYGACWRVAKALGYHRLITYSLPEESGASLRGAGWKLIGQRGGGSWSCKSRPRVDTHPLQEKLLWERSCNAMEAK